MAWARDGKILLHVGVDLVLGSCSGQDVESDWV